MKFLADENIPLFIIKQLEGKRIDIKHVSTNHIGISDEEVINLANKEDRVLITFDSDFGDLIFKKGKTLSTGLIFFRLGRFLPEEPGKILLTILEEKQIDFIGHVSVINKETIRQRKIR